MRLLRRVFVPLLLLVLLSGAYGTLSKRDKKNKKSKDKVAAIQAANMQFCMFNITDLTVQDLSDELPTESVEERDLVTSSPKWKEIVSNHNLYSTAHQHTRNMMDGAMVLGYVTPVRYAH